MINFDDYANKNKTEHNLKWPYIPDRSYLINKRESIGLKYFNNM